MIKKINAIKFSRTDSKEFFKTLNKRVNTYFKENNISKNGNWKIWFKTIIMFSLLLTPYILISIVTLPSWIQVLLSVIMGIGLAGIGMNVMHDGNHGSFSKKKWINRLMGGSIYLLAGNRYNWQVQHNVLHHTYTNIDEADDDLNAPFFLRFSPHAKHYWVHQFQHIYIWFFYSISTISWITSKDFVRLKRYKNMGFFDKKNEYEKTLAAMM